MSWQGLWLGMFWVVLILFAVMSVVVTVLGIRDIKTMLARLASQAADQDEDDEEGYPQVLPKLAEHGRLPLDGDGY